MGIRLSCPNGHKLHVKAFLAGKRGICPTCGARFLIPADADAAEKQAPPSSSTAATPSVVIPVDQATPERVVTSPPPPVVFEPPPSASPAGEHFSNRRRNRRHTQLTAAIVLLIVTLVLVLVLIWVLWTGRGEASARRPTSVHLVQSLSGQYVAAAQPPFTLAPIHQGCQT